jgi:excisionase family DNA binding protein
MMSQGDTLDAVGAAKLLNLHVSRIHQLARKGELPFETIGGQRRFRLEDLERWQQEHPRARTSPNESKKVMDLLVGTLFIARSNGMGIDDINVTTDSATVRVGKQIITITTNEAVRTP